MSCAVQPGLVTNCRYSILPRLLRWAGRQPAFAATVIAIAFFYLSHLIFLFVVQVPGQGGSYHWFVTALCPAWAGGAAFFQWLLRRPAWHLRAIFGWVTMVGIRQIYETNRLGDYGFLVGPRYIVPISFLLVGIALTFLLPFLRRGWPMTAACSARPEISSREGHNRLA